MKKKFSFKRTVVLLTVLLIFAILPFSVSALETTLTTTVPSEFSVELEIEGNGSVKVGDKTYSESTKVTVKRNEWISYEISPNEGFEIKSVFYNGENVSKELKDHVLTVFCDKYGILSVSFIPMAKNPITGDSSNLLGAIYILILSVIILTTITLWKKKEQYL